MHNLETLCVVEKPWGSINKPVQPINIEDKKLAIYMP